MKKSSVRLLLTAAALLLIAGPFSDLPNRGSMPG